MQPNRRPKKLLTQIAIAAVVAILVGFGSIALVMTVIGNVSDHSAQIAKEAEQKAKRAQAELEKIKRDAMQKPVVAEAIKTKEVHALVDISPGEPITQADLTVVESEGMRIPNSASSPADVIGKVAVAPILAGELITMKKLMQSENLLHVTAGMRAITINLDSISSLDGALLPGSYVDVLITMNDKSKNAAPGNGASLTRTLLQNIQVIALGGSAASATPGAPGKSGNGVTMLVTPAQAELLTLAQQQAKLTLSLRNFKDRSNVQVPGADVDTLITGLNGADTNLTMKKTMPTPPRVPRNLVMRDSGKSAKGSGKDSIVPVNYSPQALPEPSMPQDGAASGKNGGKFSMKVYTGSGSQTVVFE